MERFPNEIWIRIFKHLKTYDIINFCKAFNNVDYFLRDKDIVRYFDLGCNFKIYNLDINKFIAEDVGYHHIVHLNINKMYWVPVENVRKIIKLLPNLTELLALDTRLSVREKDLKTYSKLRKLALTVEEKHFPTQSSMYSNNLYLLKSFCLKVILKKCEFHEIYTLFSEAVGIEELWIYDADDSISQPIKYDFIVYSLKFLKKLVIRSKVNIPFLDYKPFGLAKVFETRRFKSIMMGYVKVAPKEPITPLKDVSIFEPFETEVEQAWDVLQKFHCELPCSRKCSEIIYKTRQIKNMEFDELNFYHNKCFCNPSFVNATATILKSENCKNLKKLSIKSCILQGTRDKSNLTTSLNKVRHTFEAIVRNCKYLEELEIMSCTNCNVTILGGYPLIAKFKRLQKLALEIPVHLDGKFLAEILESCKNLKSLKVMSVGSNESLNMKIYNFISEANRLEEFTFENTHINLDRFFSALNNIKDCRLQRVFLKCDYADTYYMTPMEIFLENNPQMLLLFLTLAKNAVTENTRIQNIMNKYKKEDPHKKIFFTKKDETIYIGNWPIPEAHRDIITFETNVSVVDFYEFRYSEISKTRIITGLYLNLRPLNNALRSQS